MLNPSENYEVPDTDFEKLASNWPELEIENSHSETMIEIWASSYGGIHFFWRFIDKNSQDGFYAIDRLFETRGQALDDVCDFIQEVIINGGYEDK